MTDPESRQAERRQLTIMFCDLVGSTELSVRFDPEDLQTILDAFQKTCTGIVEQYGGTVARYMGDGMLVHFGYPQAQEDAPERAAQAGLDVVEAVRTLGVFDVELHTRIGIGTGEVVVGHRVGEGIAREHSVLGTTPNLAARLQEIAAPDTVVISESTHGLIGRVFEYEELGERSLKGFSEPVPAWRVLRRSGLESRFEAIHPQRQLTPLVGRQEELARLVSAWRKAQSGEGQVVILGGEGGIGKSRLVRELSERIETEPATRLTYYGVPYYRNSALHAVTTQLERSARLGRDDSADTKLRKLEVLIEQATPKAAEAVPLLASLLSIPTAGRYEPLLLSPELQREQTLATLESLVFGLARRRPVIIVVEDLQWIDAVTHELIGRLIRKVHSIPALLLLTHRPEYVPSIPARSYVTRVVLDRLVPDDCVAFMRTVAGGKALPEQILEHLLDKSDGVPLYIEELTKSVLESGALDEGSDSYSLSGELLGSGLPNTLQDSLMARLERQGTARTVAQRSAVIGRRFSYKLASAICDLEEAELRNALDDLAGAELVFPRGRHPDVLYEFKHALVQEAAYWSLLRDHRKTLHARVARALEQDSPETVENEPELIAHHYMKGGLEAEAIPYLLRAGQRASERAAHDQSVRYLEEALSLISHLPAGTERDTLELNAQALMGIGLAAGRSYALPEVERAYQRARVLCSRLGDEAAERFPVIRSGLVTYYLVRAQHVIADELANDFVRTAESAAAGAQSHPEAIGYRIDAHRCLGYTRFFRGDLEGARASLQRAVELYEANDHYDLEFRMPENPVVAALAVMPLVLWLLGEHAEASRRHEQGLEVAAESDHPFNRAFVHSWATVFQQWCGAPQSSEAHVRDAMELSATHGFHLWLRVGKMHLGLALAAQGRAAEGVALLTETLPSLEEDGVEAFGSYYRYGLAACHLAAGNTAEALSVLRDALTHAEEHDERFFEPELHRLHGELELVENPDATAEAEADFARALELAQRHGARSLALRAAVSRHRLLAGQGRGRESYAALEALVAELAQGPGFAELEQARALLGATE